MSGRHVPAGTTIFKLDAGGDLAAVMAAAPRYTVRHPFSLPANARSALGGAVFVVDVNSAQASSFGNFYELYAIAGAVLGGCALRGGECSVLGLILGAAPMRSTSAGSNVAARPRAWGKQVASRAT